MAQAGRLRLRTEVCITLIGLNRICAIAHSTEQRTRRLYSFFDLSILVEGGALAVWHTVLLPVRLAELGSTTMLSSEVSGAKRRHW